MMMMMMMISHTTIGKNRVKTNLLLPVSGSLHFIRYSADVTTCFKTILKAALKHATIIRSGLGLEAIQDLLPVPYCGRLCFLHNRVE